MIQTVLVDEEAHLRLAQLVHFHVHDGDKVLDLVPGVDEIVVGQLLAVDGDALVDVFQMATWIIFFQTITLRSSRRFRSAPA